MIDIQEYYDLIVIGSGLAGIYTALNVTSEKKVLLISKDEIRISNSSLAQGGIAGEIQNDDIAYQKHIEDTLLAGAYLNNRDALETLVYESSHNLNKLIHYGVNFDRDDEGNLLLTREGGHSERRILHAGGDATGKEIINALISLVLHKDNITVLENTMAIDLIIDNNTCLGVSVLVDDKYFNIYSTSTALCTGGLGEIYKNSTNPAVATGDGIAMAYRAGANINNMEFIQFHPTAFFIKTTGSRFLISEAVRGEGGYIRNIEGKRFMHKYHHLLELAPRDVVSQSIYREMYDTWSDHVYLDVTHLDAEFIKKRFPTIYQKCLDYGIDMTKDYIPVAPVEHFSVGGISVDLNGRTTIHNLYANGECCDSGVHGANRLASNSLLECVVFGERIAKNINEIENNKTIMKKDEKTIKISYFNYQDIRNQIKEIMERNVGIVRKEKNLVFAKEKIAQIISNLEKNQIICKTYYEVHNMATVASLIIYSALDRKESVGCHYRIN
ncbi:L-aspartate oxidase [Mycoplasmatota bacterium]|nr:L-aspartate oxidase [Mycoplasmatota bacterium]